MKSATLTFILGLSLSSAGLIALARWFQPATFTAGEAVIFLLAAALSAGIISQLYAGN